MKRVIGISMLAVLLLAGCDEDHVPINSKKRVIMLGDGNLKNGVSEYCYDGTVYISYWYEMSPKVKDGHFVSCEN